MKSSAHHSRNKRLVHGALVEFIENKFCTHCHKRIVKEPCLYVFLYRSTPSHQSGYYHMACVSSKAKVGSGIDRITGKVFRDKPHYSFPTDRAGKVVINKAFIQKLLKLNKAALYKECLKSSNKVNKNKLIEHISYRTAQSLGVAQVKGELANKRARSKKFKHLTIKEIVAQLKVSQPTSITTAGTTFGVGYRTTADYRRASIQFKFRVRNRLVDIKVSSNPSKQVSMRIPSLYTNSKGSRSKDLLNTQLMYAVLREHPAINKIYKRAFFFRRNSKYVELLSLLEAKPRIDDTTSSLKKKILQRALYLRGITKPKQLSEAPSLQSGDYISLLLDPNATLRDLAKKEILRLNKKKRLRPSNDVHPTPETEKSSQISQESEQSLSCVAS